MGIIKRIWAGICMTSPLTLMIFVFVVMASQYAQAADVEVCWQAPVENVDGTPITDIPLNHRILWGVQSGVYPNDALTDVPTDGCHTLDLQPDTYYFVMTAIDASGDESAYSNEIMKEAVDDSPIPPVIIQSERPVFTVIKQPDRFVLLPIGTVPAGTSCDPNNSVNGHGAVPNVDVEWSAGSTARPIVVVALCDG